MESAVRKSQAVVSKPISLGYVARQPILSADERVFGYELLFRDGVQNYFVRGTDMEVASLSTVDASLLLGLDVLCDGRLAFINCTRDMLLKEYLTLLPSNQAVIEILEDVAADDLVVAACQRMKRLGYKIALDDFVGADCREALIDLADIIKVDIRLTGVERAAAIVTRYASNERLLLAEKVETREEYSATRDAGFSYFQGYFFRKPELMHARQIPANRISYVRLLKAVSGTDWNPREVENILKSEASFCYRLLRYLNSPVFGLSREIQDIRQALAILGERELRRWIRMTVTLAVGHNKPSDLVLSALVRGRFCELIAAKIACGDSDLFLLGLLSLMDAILEVPIGLVLEGISLRNDMREALLGNGGPLAPILKLVIAQESGNWDAVHELGRELHLPPAFVAESYWNSMHWARVVTSGA